MADHRETRGTRHHGAAHDADLDEAEQLADRIAILHQGRIIVNGTLTELRQLLPPAKVEYVEKQPTLEDVFFAIVGDDGKHGDPDNDHSVGTDK